MLPGFVRRSIAVSGRGAVLGFYLNQVGWVFFFVLDVFLSMLVGCGGGGEDVRGASATLSWDPGHGTAGIIILCIMGKVRLENWDLAIMSIPSMCPSPTP